MRITTRTSSRTSSSVQIHERFNRDDDDSILLRNRIQGYLEEEVITVKSIGTHQGKKNIHTNNGCAMLSALIANKHLGSIDGINPESIKKVIDEDGPKFCSTIRKRLRMEVFNVLGQNEVYYELQHFHNLFADGYVSNFSGNILDEDTLLSLLECLEMGYDISEHRSKTIPAPPARSSMTILFHGHVISVHQMKVDGDYNFVFVDTLDTFPLHISSELQDTAKMVICKEKDIMNTLIRWYAMTKFTDEEFEFIQTTNWVKTHNSLNNDPRVFEAWMYRTMNDDSNDDSNKKRKRKN